LLHTIFYLKYKFVGFNHRYISYQRLFLLAIIPALFSLGSDSHGLYQLPGLLLNISILFFDTHMLKQAIDNKPIDQFFPDLDVTPSGKKAFLIYSTLVGVFTTTLFLSYKIDSEILFKSLLSYVLGCAATLLWGQNNRWQILSRIIPSSCLLLTLGYFYLPQYNPINIGSLSIYVGLLLTYIHFLFSKKTGVVALTQTS
jgi:hypothetical protein